MQNKKLVRLDCLLQICYSAKSVFYSKKSVESLFWIKGLSELNISPCLLILMFMLSKIYLIWCRELSKP